jgi:hypothetical protein
LKTDNILKQKALAFSLVGMSALGAVFKEQSGIEGSLLLNGFLIASLALGVFFWIASKRMEWRSRRDSKENSE